MFLKKKKYRDQFLTLFSLLSIRPPIHPPPYLTLRTSYSASSHQNHEPQIPINHPPSFCPMKNSFFNLLLFLPLISAHNIVHIQIYDLRTEIGAYNPNHPIKTPNIDRLAKKGVAYDRAYAQQALCNPSRASYMTGRYPDTTKIWNLIDNWRYMGNKNSQLWTSLPGMFLAAGFKALGSGKTYHDTVQNGIWNAIFEYDSFRSWSKESLPYRNPGWTQGIDFLGCPETRWGGNVTTAWCERELGDMSGEHGGSS